jgi:hypothetical protein
MFAIGFKVKRPLTYSWDSVTGQHIVRNFAEGLTLDLAKSEGSLVPVASDVLYVQAQNNFDPHDYFGLLVQGSKYAKSSVKITGHCFVPEHADLYYQIGERSVPLLGNTLLYQFKGSFGRECFVTTSGVKVDVRKIRKHLNIFTT